MAAGHYSLHPARIRPDPRLQAPGSKARQGQEPRTKFRLCESLWQNTERENLGPAVPEATVLVGHWEPNALILTLLVNIPQEGPAVPQGPSVGDTRHSVTFTSAVQLSY